MNKFPSFPYLPCPNANSPQVYADLEKLFTLIALNCVLRNGDGHVKNFGMVYDEVLGEARLAPIYDLVTTSVYLAQERTAQVCMWTERMQFFQTEAIMGLNEQRVGIWRLSLEQIEATVADHLGSGRVPGNQPGPCFSRQVAMYLAKNVAGWSTTRIGRLYNGRHHTTVLHAIAKIERVRQTDETLDALIEVLTSALSPTVEGQLAQVFERGWSTALIDAIAARVLGQISATNAG